MEPIIEVKNLVKVFHSRGKRITAVNVSFNVFKGEIFGMIGPNGAGKSTTFSMLTTLIKPTSGSIKVAWKMAILKIRLMIDSVFQTQIEGRGHIDI